MAEVEIIMDGGRRRRWSYAEKLRIGEKTLDGSENISAVARRNGVARELAFANPVGSRDVRSGLTAVI